MKQIYDVVSLGEILIDFTQNGISPQGNPLFEANPGGAPCNVLAMLQKLGKKTSFIGKAGKDSFGILLKQTLENIEVSTDALYFDENIPTTLAFVHKKEDGDRDFSFYRNPGADMCLSEDELPEELLKNCRIFHFGTLSMTDHSVLNATKKAIGTAKKAGALLSFDPNLRPPLWKDMKKARSAFEYGFSCCDILKISDNEIEWFTECEDIETGIRKIRNHFHIPLVLASMGPNGSRAYYKEIRIEIPAFENPDPVDTTGAGDTFCACCLNTVLEKGLDHLTKKDLQDMLLFANAAASIVTTKKGALLSMPELEEIERMLQKAKDR